MRMSTTSRRGGWRMTAAAIVTGAALALTGCGGDDDGGDSTDVAASEEDSASEDESGDDEASNDEASSDDSESDESSDDGGDSGASGDYCDMLMNMGTEVMGDMSSMSDPDGAGDLAAIYRELAGLADGQAADDWNTMADAMEMIANDNAGEMAEMATELQDASSRLTTHVTDACA